MSFIFFSMMWRHRSDYVFISPLGDPDQFQIIDLLRQVFTDKDTASDVDTFPLQFCWESVCVAKDIKYFHDQTYWHRIWLTKSETAAAFCKAVSCLIKYYCEHSCQLNLGEILLTGHDEVCCFNWVLIEWLMNVYLLDLVQKLSNPRKSNRI